MSEALPAQSRAAGQWLGQGWCLLGIAMRGMLSERIQLLLTLSTMAIGALALAATLSIGDGALRGLWRNLDEMMGNRAEFYPDAGPYDTLLKQRDHFEFTPGDLAHLRLCVPEARYVVPIAHGMALISRGQTELRMTVDGVMPEMEQERAFAPVEGRGFCDDARAGYVLECLLTASAARALGVRLDDASLIAIDDMRFRVVGIVPDPPEADARFQTRAVVSYACGRQLWGGPRAVGNICVAWKHPEDMATIVKEAQLALDSCRAPGSYHTDSSQFRIRKGKAIVANFMAFGSILGAFCVVVAAIGITNVMLANVVRRTHEFAIRMAMGAPRWHLSLIVIIESGCTGLLGGLAGVGSALLAAGPLCRVAAPAIPQVSQLAPEWSVRSMAIPLVLCAATGLVAGIVPALNVRRRDLLCALRAD